MEAISGEPPQCFQYVFIRDLVGIIHAHSLGKDGGLASRRDARDTPIGQEGDVNDLARIVDFQEEFHCVPARTLVGHAGGCAIHPAPVYWFLPQLDCPRGIVPSRLLVDLPLQVFHELVKLVHFPLEVSKRENLTNAVRALNSPRHDGRGFLLEILPLLCFKILAKGAFQGFLG